MENGLLVTRELSKSYREPAVDRVSLTVKQGQIFGLVGKNGAGKTTLIRMATGQTLPTSGELFLFGENSRKGLEKMRSRIGCMVETPSFFPYLTAEENLEYYRLQRGIPGKDSVQTGEPCGYGEEKIPELFPWDEAAAGAGSCHYGAPGSAAAGRAHQRA